MKLGKLKIPPCAKCPYKLGLAQTLVNPCPQCKTNGYAAYEQFRKRAAEEDPNPKGRE